MSSAANQEFRQEVREWIEQTLPVELRVGNRKETSGTPAAKKWIKDLADKGWIVPDWPTEYGGGGLDRKQAQIVRSELAAFRAPVVKGFGVSMLGPTLLEFGTEEQKEKYLPELATGKKLVVLV